MYRLALPLCLFVFATTAVAAEKKSCPSGVIGPACGRYNPCKTGYTCIRRKCCRDVIVNECPVHALLLQIDCNTPDQCKTDADCRKGELCCTSSCARYCKGPGFPG